MSNGTNPHLQEENTSEPSKEKPTWPKIEKLMVVDDPLAFIANKCSQNARKIFSEIERINIELWFDKHYHDRHQHGDDAGKRSGIDPQTVENLVRKSLKHLLLYGSVIRGFKFIHYPDSVESPVRVVLQEEFEQSVLNVVIETHFVEINRYEITVKTAMCVEDFRLGQGQYSLEIHGDTSTLRRRDNNGVVKVCEF